MLVHLRCQPDWIRNHPRDTPLGVPKRTFPEWFKGERKASPPNVGGTNLCIMSTDWIKMNTNRPGWLSLSCYSQIWGVPCSCYTFPAMADGTPLTVSQKNYFFSNVAFCQLSDDRDKKVTGNSISVEVISFLPCSPHVYGRQQLERAKEEIKYHF